MSPLPRSASNLIGTVFLAVVVLLGLAAEQD
jgi:hypothetical protein